MFQFKESCISAITTKFIHHLKKLFKESTETSVSARQFLTH